ncbi:MAG: DUF1214 domain-containing protein [Thermoanaerobaculia bacterium]
MKQFCRSSFTLRCIVTLFAVSTMALALPATGGSAGSPELWVDADNFIRAESDLHLQRLVKQGAFGKLKPERESAAIDGQIGVRGDRATLDAAAVFDLDAAPVTFTLPDPAGRYLSMQVVSEDHFTIAVAHAPGRFTFTREQVGTRYLCVIVRAQADLERKADLKEARRLLRAIRVEQAKSGKFEVRRWEKASQDRMRGELADLAARGGLSEMFGPRTEVDPLSHRVGTAIGWGSAPRSAIFSETVTPASNDGQTVHFLTVRKVPVDGFWSLTVDNSRKTVEADAHKPDSLNSRTAKPNRDGSFTVQFGGCQERTSNCLPITPGWSSTVRLYRPGAAVLDGSWKFPIPKPVSAPAS